MALLLKQCFGTNSASNTPFLPPSKGPDGVGGGAWLHERAHAALVQLDARHLGGLAHRRHEPQEQRPAQGFEPGRGSLAPILILF